jgi:RND family efflux transporter MFP subunit
MEKSWKSVPISRPRCNTGIYGTRLRIKPAPAGNAIREGASAAVSALCGASSPGVRWLLARCSFALAAAMALALAAVGAAYLYHFRPPPLVKVATAVLGPVSEIIYASGIVEPVQWAKVVPFQRRRVVELCRCEGQTVTKGQVLGRQDDAEERGLLKEMQIRHEQLLRDLDRAARDRDKNSISKAEYEQRETAVRESSSRISTQEGRLETLVFRAPMDGVVLRRDGEVGEIVGPTDVLFWVGKPSPLQVVADISEEEITKVAVGQTAFLSNEAFARRSLRASVSRITLKGDPTTKTFRVNLLLPHDSPLRIGMTVDVNIVFKEKRGAVVVPVDAVSAGTVQVVSDDRVRRVSVSTGIRGSQSVEIISGVIAGTLLLSPARSDLKDGARVRVELPAKPEAKPGAGPDDDELAISTSLSRQIDSILNDARRNAPRTP